MFACKINMPLLNLIFHIQHMTSPSRQSVDNVIITSPRRMEHTLPIPLYTIYTSNTWQCPIHVNTCLTATQIICKRQRLMDWRTTTAPVVMPTWMQKSEGRYSLYFRLFPNLYCLPPYVFFSHGPNVDFSFLLENYKQTHFFRQTFISSKEPSTYERSLQNGSLQSVSKWMHPFVSGL